MSTIVANRVKSSSSSSSSSTSQSKQEHVKDENNDTNNNDYHNNKNINNSSSFFNEWKLGNWCWERDYNKYPVVVVVVALPANNNNNNNCHDGNGINDRSNDAKINTTEHYEQCDDERKLCDNDHDNSSSSSIDERKPAAIQYSSIDSSRRSVTTTASATMEIAATATKKDVREISTSKHPQIKVESNHEKKNTTNDINDFNSNNYYNENNNDDDDDDSFYDDWVEGNWCLLDNSDNSNKEVEGKGNDEDNSLRKMQHEVTTTPSLKKKSRNNNNESTRRKLKRFRYDDNDGSYNEDDEDDDKKEEEEFIPKDSKGVHNHQEDKRLAKKRSQRQTHYDNRYDQKWMEMFQKLVEYKKQHKNTIVPNNYKTNPKLGLWVFTQRRCCRNDKLIPNRYALLDSIGFEWDGIKCKAVSDQIKWMNMFQKLVAYKKQRTTTMVPKIYEEDPPLGRWVETQREVYRKDKLLPNRCALLKSIGFNLDAYNENYQQLWMGMFQKLLAYKEQHKNTTVPNQKSKLGRWVCKQRYFYDRGELLPARIALLKSIGFTWRWVGVKK